MKYDYLIGIDPDVKSSGIAQLEVSSRRLHLDTQPFPQLIDTIVSLSKSIINSRQTLLVIVEAGWLNEKSCFHAAKGKGAERIAKNVGANHQTGRLIIEMLRYHQIPVEEIKPLQKHWKGTEGKITHEELSYFTGIKVKRSNQEQRDAALIAWWYAGLSIKIKSE
ncbi:MAG: hypothetical protein PUB21_11875 [Bacteroidales bacterium]|nr:hypothetical protein [Bacteroidales bacterium]